MFQSAGIDSYRFNRIYSEDESPDLQATTEFVENRRRLTRDPLEILLVVDPGWLTGDRQKDYCSQLVTDYSKIGLVFYLVSNN